MDYMQRLLNAANFLMRKLQGRVVPLTRGHVTVDMLLGWVGGVLLLVAVATWVGDAAPWVILIPSTISPFFLLLSTVIRTEPLRRVDFEDPSARIRRRVRRVNGAFDEAVQLMEELRGDLEAQQVAREVLLEQAEEQQRLLDLNAEQAEQIRKILISDSRAARKADRRSQWMFFVLGAGVSIPIGILINLWTQ